MKTRYLKKFLYLFFLSVSVAGAQDAGIMTDSTHNCRFWGMLTSGDFQDGSKLSHLDALKALAPSNPHGWGFGFFTQTVRGGHIPVIYRGMWRADQDCLYDSSAVMMIQNLSSCGIVHIRNASEGYINIPNPHPFYTKSMQRNFSMLFAHNGSLDITMLRKFLGPYTQTNHFSYSDEGSNDPNHDSDLYRLYLMKWIDENPNYSITKCLVDALNMLTFKMGPGYSYNFVMGSPGDTLWALRYNSSLSYRHEEGSSGYVWEVASQPLGGTDWMNARNYFLYIFTTGKATPDSIQINHVGSWIPETQSIPEPLNFSFINPSGDDRLEITIESSENQVVSIQLIDNQGEIVSEMSGIPLQIGKNTAFYDISGLNPGLYYVQISSETIFRTKKLILYK